MGRWRPPIPRSSPYITPEGYVDLENELKRLWMKRKEVTQALSAAAAEGDRSENAEYIYRKKELRGIDRRIGYLQKRLPLLKVVTETPADQNRVFFGAWVTLEHESGNQVSYRIVGSDEVDPAKGNISLDSPMAHALLKKTCDDEVVIISELGETRYVILDIRFCTISDR